MKISLNLAEEAKQYLEQATNILIISHRNPDADSIGSNLGLREILERKNKNVLSACVDVVTSGLEFLEKTATYVQDFPPDWPELIVCVDAGSESQVGFPAKYPELLSGKIPVLNIDHHASNNHYGTINIVFPEAASTTIVLYYLFQLWGEVITPAIATCLLYGLYYDTGSFMHSNTNAEVYEVAGNLVRKGANFGAIIKNLFHQNRIEQLRLWGKLFENAELTAKNVVVAGVTYKDLLSNQATSADLSGAINYLNTVKGNTFATMISEDGKGNIRGSLRTKNNDINLAEIAEMLGGGGHKKACGFTMQGELKKETRWIIKPEGEMTKSEI